MKTEFIAPQQTKSSGSYQPPSNTKDSLPRLPTGQVDLTTLFKHPESLLTTSQTSEILDVTEGTLSVWRCTGRHALRYIKASRKIRYRVSDIRDFLKKNTRHQTE